MTGVDDLVPWLREHPWGIDVSGCEVVDPETLSARCRAIRDATPSVAEVCAALDEFVRAAQALDVTERPAAGAGRALTGGVFRRGRC